LDDLPRAASKVLHKGIQVEMRDGTTNKKTYSFDGLASCGGIGGGVLLNIG
jgi:hypothetical protein